MSSPEKSLSPNNLNFQKKEFKEAEQLSNIALGLDLQDDFKAMIYLQLMNIYGTKNNRVKVEELYQKAKKQPTNKKH